MTQGTITTAIDQIDQAVRRPQNGYLNPLTLFQSFMPAQLNGNLPNLTPANMLPAFVEYWLDAVQRNVMFWDALRQRGNMFHEHETKNAPPVLVFDYEILIDGRDLEHPVNYALLRIIPKPEHSIDPRKRPYVIVDPRAGHGPGIGGSKEDSQIGVALAAGHPVYFVAFRPIPEPGQTLVDVGRAESVFLEEVRKRHPEAPKPCVIGNCQAGWAVAMLASVRPDLMGPIILSGAPMSYWAGAEGANPMRYLGGVWGGAWITSLMCDLGNGRFDGAYLVSNFENLNPANTLWSKQYNLYSKIDTEPARYLNFEKWWTGFFLLTTDEMEFIVDNLFIGNKLATNQISLEDGTVISLKEIKAPIVIFASGGDNITPPQQALNWILDVYETDDEIIQDDQVIVYCLHKDIGHLGIFVSGGVARKEHTAFVGTMDFIDMLPPGLYEMVIDKTDSIIEDYDGLPGYEVRFVERRLKDIGSLDDTREEEKYFDTLATLSDITTNLYKTFARPAVQPFVNEQTAETLRQLNPQRLQHAMLSDRNPFMLPVKYWAELARQSRRPASADNPFLALQNTMSDNIVGLLDAYRDMRDNSIALWFKLVYGPMGLGMLFPPRTERVRVESEAERTFKAQREQLVSKVDQGGFLEGTCRLITLLSRADEDVEPRALIQLRQVVQKHPRLKDMSADRFVAMHKEQYVILHLDREGAIAAVPKLLASREDRMDALAIARQVVLNDYRPNIAEQDMLDQLETLLELKERGVVHE